jgi:hypothetical protein
MLAAKINQCSNNVKNSTTSCVERVYNRTIMDEEFKALLEYVEHQLLGKIIVGLEAT